MIQSSSFVRHICLALALCFAVAWQPAVAQPSIDPVEDAKSALRKTKQPWYDIEKDAVRIVNGQKRSEVGERKDWQKPKRPDWSIEWGDWGANWNLGNWGGFVIGNLFQSLGIVLLLLVVGALIYFLIRTFMNLEGGDDDVRSVAKTEVRTDEQRIQNLPMQPTKKTGDFLALAKSAYEAGNYADAIIYLFSYRLIQLDRAGYIRLTRGKTNRQYLSEITSGRELQSILGNTIVCFEDVFFGKHMLTKERFDTTWHANDRFANIIEKSTT